MTMDGVLRLVLCVVLWNQKILFSYAACDTTYAGTPTFKNCEYRCHCKDDVQCELNTGDCSNGCAFGWMGPSCQYRNVVKGNSQTENRGGTNTDSEFAIFAVDGDNNTCCKTSTLNGFGGKKQYWRIKLKRQYRVVGIVLHVPAADIDNFAKFRILYGDSWDGMSSVCYQHPNIQGSSVMNIICQQPVWTQYMRVILDVTDTSLRICEFEIYGGRDVAFNRQTTGPSSYSDWYTYLAVDGRFLQTGDTAGSHKTCSASSRMLTPWWQLDLGIFYDIHDIFYYGRESTNLGQMQGFVVSVGSSTSTLQDIYTDPRNSGDVYQPHETNLESTYRGQHVKLRLPDITNAITICELLIFAECPVDTCDWDCSLPCHCKTQYITVEYKLSGICPDGCSGRWTGVDGKCDQQCTNTQWGTNCEYTCGDCLDTSCNLADGLCPNNCTGASKPPLCAEGCDDFWYGQNCEYPCGDCKHNRTCDNINGMCSNGCVEGVKGDLCTTPCDGMMYGEDCAYNCGNCFEVLQCDLKSGVCDKGCDRGYSGELCQQECSKGSYGYNCNETCGECAEDNGCDIRIGVCSDGCNDGYVGELCKSSCGTGSYGRNCSDSCGHCIKDTTCHHENGTCLNGCDLGYQLPTCNQECPKGFYGYNCNETCGECAGDNGCDIRIGVCGDGCNDGYTGELCKSSCDAGSYGRNCSDNCGNCLGNSTCHHENGTCLDGCVLGYQLSTCKQECLKGFYGYNCNVRCGECAGHNGCDSRTGVCSDGCTAGYMGELCKSTCSNGTYGQNCSKSCGKCAQPVECNRTDGACGGNGCISGFTGDGCTVESRYTATEIPSDSNTAVIAGSVSAVVVVATIVAVVVVIFFRRRQASVSRKYKGKVVDDVKDDPVEPNVYSNAIPTETTKEQDEESVIVEDPVEYGNIVAKTRLISVANIRRDITAELKNPDKLLAEYAALPRGIQSKYATTAALKPNNKPKNRYKSMFPYDASRVKLPLIVGIPDSDYINASYIDGYHIPRKYIAAQGAIDDTVDDIWRMIWSENIRIIAMVTNLTEMGQMKCVQYWFSGTGIVGDFEIELLEEDVYTNFVVRKFKCTNLKKTKDKSRIITQYNFTAWPDKDVPDTALSLVQFWNKIRSSAEASFTPWMVHCSAGIGRTGTFIALDYLYDQGSTESHISINGAVASLREQRLTMVQTKEQYLYLHTTVVEALAPIGQVCKNEEYVVLYPVSRSGKPVQLLNKEFSAICDDTETAIVIQSKELATLKKAPSAKREENTNKSRTSEIFPDDLFRPRLNTIVDGHNDFINAVFVSTFRQDKQLILTQVPLPNTVVDFLRLIWEFEVDTVILLESKIDKESCYWPGQGMKVTHGPMTVEIVLQQTEATHTKLKLKLSWKGKSESREVNIFQLTQWSSTTDKLPSSRDFLGFLADVQNSGANSPIVVQCFDGARKSGLVAVIWCVLDRMKTDREVAIAESTRLVRMRRSQAITGVEQYRFCHSVIQEYIDSFEVYANAL